MVYTISENVERIGEIGNTMDAKFQKINTTENDGSFNELDQKEKLKIWKNVLLIGFAFMIHFTAFWGASNLQSSVNSEAALGTFTLASIYGSLLISNILLPALVIKWLGTKWTIALSFILYMPFILSQFHPAFYTLIPSGLAVGLGGGPLWCAKCTYLTVISEAYAKLAGVRAEVAVTRFFGIFFMFYNFSQVWGNLISSAILSSGDATPMEGIGNGTSSVADVLTKIESDNSVSTESQCGANFCPGSASADATPALAPPSPAKINLIAGIYFFCMVAAVAIVSIGVDRLSRYRKNRNNNEPATSGWKLLIVTLKHAKQPLQILILPITMFIGAEQAFLAADYTAAFVSCSWGISNIGFVMVCFGVCNGLASIFSGSLAKITGRRPVVYFAFLLHMVLLVTLLLWRPSPDRNWVFFLVSGLWGVCDALWLVQNGV
ncbi:unnamed protein product [Phyllotreta striolata]|uniref:UNC93-like protein n=1 Tax=Phyllotreta striolata TaxID=444603 RepID=A0A9N9TR44_PHYSR|nr:unnamed protein product [Phyllotreta striolata]